MIILIIPFLVFAYFTVTWKIQCRKNKLLNLPKKLDIINLGSTYAYYDFSYEGTGLAGGNLANVAQYLDMDLLLLQKYIKRLKENGKVLIVLPEFVFASDTGNYNRKVYYETLNFWKIKEFSIREWMKCVWKAAKEPFTHEYQLAEERWKGHVASKEEKERHVKGRISDWKGKLGIPDTRTGEITDELCNRIKDNKRRVSDLIELCREKKAEPVLVIPPVSEIMHREVTDECLEVYLKTPVWEIAKEKGIRVYDYRKREELCDEAFYLNSDCLNEQGKRFFMKLLLQDIYNNRTK